MYNNKLNSSPSELPLPGASKAIISKLSFKLNAEIISWKSIAFDPHPWVSSTLYFPFPHLKVLKLI